ncbi:MAG: DUF1232 domain-containing protein [Acidobacteriota bacterium]
MSSIDDSHLDEALSNTELRASASTGLLSFYDRLRQRITDFVEERTGELGGKTAEALLVVPDIFILLTRLALDRDVPNETRALVASALAYFVLPFDILPEGFVGPMGFVDDLILAVAVLTHVFDDELEPITERYWSGSAQLRSVLGDVLDTAHALVGKSVFGRLIGLLEKRGIKVDIPTDDSEAATADTQ